MEHVLSTHIFVNHRLTTFWLEKIWQAGVPAVEIFCARQHLDYRDKAQINELGHWFRDSELKIHALHSPMYSDDVWGRTGPNSHINITEPVKSKRMAMLEEIKRTLDIADTIPFRYLIQHIGVKDEEYSEHKVDAAFTALEEINLFARERGVEVLLENIPNQLSSAQRLVSFLDQTHLKMNFCLDVGHANMNEGISTAFTTMKGRIRSTHLHDNDGAEDNHFWPFFSPAGTINWKETIACAT
jgi:sugar phosphate isomerase/epimerase